jgi:hypothetical protein
VELAVGLLLGRVAGISSTANEIISVMLLFLDGMYWALMVMLCCKLSKTNLLTMGMTLVDLEVAVFRTCTTAELSM